MEELRIWEGFGDGPENPKKGFGDTLLFYNLRKNAHIYLSLNPKRGFSGPSPNPLERRELYG